MNPQICPLFLRLDETRGTDIHPIIASFFSSTNFTKFFDRKKEAYLFINKTHRHKLAVNLPTRFGVDPI